MNEPIKQSAPSREQPEICPSCQGRGEHEAWCPAKPEHPADATAGFSRVCMVCGLETERETCPNAFCGGFTRAKVATAEQAEKQMAIYVDGVKCATATVPEQSVTPTVGLTPEYVADKCIGMPVEYGAVYVREYAEQLTAEIARLKAELAEAKKECGKLRARSGLSVAELERNWMAQRDEARCQNDELLTALKKIEEHAPKEKPPKIDSDNYGDHWSNGYDHAHWNCAEAARAAIANAKIYEKPQS